MAFKCIWQSQKSSEEALPPEAGGDAAFDSGSDETNDTPLHSISRSTSPFDLGDEFDSSSGISSLDELSLLSEKELFPHDADSSSAGTSLSESEGFEAGSRSHRRVPFDGKLEATAQLPPAVVRGRKPFFYLPLDTEEATSPTAGGEYCEGQSLLDDPDLYPVPKGLAPSAVSAPDGGAAGGLETRSRSSPGKPPRSAAEEGIRNRILECFVRARNRTVSSSHSRSYEGDLCRLPSRGAKDSEIKGYVHNFSKGKAFCRDEKTPELMTESRDAGTITGK